MLLVGAVVLGALPSACQRSETRRTSLFETAEAHFERGEYEAALHDYQAFIDRYPRSPLAETARLRKRSINREIKAMLSGEDLPAARYLGAEGTDDESTDPPPTDRPEQPRRDTGPDGD